MLQKRVLIIDDDEGIRESLSAILKEKGYEVSVAENGREAIQKSKTEFFNLALIDIRLPDMKGTRLLSEMRETTPKMRKIIITGYPSLENAVKAVNQGADAYIIKPPDMNKLLATIERNLRRQREDQEMTEERVKEYIKTHAVSPSR